MYVGGGIVKKKGLTKLHFEFLRSPTQAP